MSIWKYSRSQRKLSGATGGAIYLCHTYMPKKNLSEAKSIYMCAIYTIGGKSYLYIRIHYRRRNSHIYRNTLSKAKYTYIGEIISVGSIMIHYPKPPTTIYMWGPDETYISQ